MRGGERGEFGVAVPCVTRVTFQVFHQPHQFLLFVREVRRKETLHLELDFRTNSKSDQERVGCGDEDGAL